MKHLQFWGGHICKNCFVGDIKNKKRDHWWSGFVHEIACSAFFLWVISKMFNETLEFEISEASEK